MSRETMLGLSGGRPLCVSLEARKRGAFAAGVTGAGKSTFLVSLITQDLFSGRGICVVDPHGQLVDDVLDRVSGFRREIDVRLFDLKDVRLSPGLNLLHCADPGNVKVFTESANMMVSCFRALWDMSDAPRMEDLLRNAVYALLETPGTTILDLIPLLTDDAARQRLTRRLTNPPVRAYWQTEYAELKPGQRQQVYSPLTNKIRKLVVDPIMRGIVGQRENAIDWTRAIRDRRIVLVRLDPTQDENSNLIGTFIIQQLLQAAFAMGERPKAEPFMLYFDECHRFVTPGFVTLLREARKYGLATTAATQFANLLPDDVAEVFLGSSTLVCFRLGDSDAKRAHAKFAGDALPRAVSQAVYDPDPLGTILSKGHADPTLVEAAKRVQHELGYYKLMRERWMSRFKRAGMPSLPNHMALVSSDLERWLYGTMRGQPPQESWERFERRVTERLVDEAPGVRDLLDAAKVLGELLEKQPLTQQKPESRVDVARALQALPNFHALVAYDAHGVRAEAFMRTLPTKPLGKRHRPAPLGISRVTPKAAEPEAEPKELIYFDQGEAGPGDPWEAR